MKSYRIAVPLTASTVSRMWRDGLSALKQGANILELRLDCLRDSEIKSEGFEILIRNCFPNTSLILTNRHKNEANPNDPNQGFKALDIGVDYETQRMKVLQRAVSLREQNPFTIDYVDIEREHFHELNLNHKKTKVIASWHKFDSTPSYQKLVEIYNHIATKSPDAIKIATMAQTSGDTKAILNLIRNYHDNIPIIAIGMSDAGRDTRVAGLKLGAYLSYACLNGKGSVLGQVSMREMKEELKIKRD